MTRATAAELVEQIRELPPLPSIVFSMNEALMSPHTSAREVARVLSSDPAVVSRLLALANSAYYGLGQRVTTVTHAVMVLGFNTVRNVVLAATIFRSLGAVSPRGAFDQHRFWKHSIACGTLSRILARRRGESHAEEMFILGLLHDVGKLVIAAWLSEDAARIRARVDEGARLHEAESEVLETTHADVGAALLERWRLPRLYVEAVRHHHTPSLAGEHRAATAVVHVADYLVDAVCLTSAPGDTIPVLSREAWSHVDLRVESLPQLFDEMFLAVGQAESILELAMRGG